MPQNLQLQLDALMLLRKHLVSMTEKISQFSESHKSRIVLMVEEGLPIQIHDTYTNSYLESHLSVLCNLVSAIEQEDMPYIDKNIEALQKLIENCSR